VLPFAFSPHRDGCLESAAAKRQKATPSPPALPEISILLPVFDAAATLPACLRSIARQTAKSWECVIVEDGSDDESLAMANLAAAADGRFRVISGPHRGLVSALNAGIGYCRGRYVARMDADDLMHRNRLSRQAAALDAAPDLSAVGSHVRFFPRRGLRDGMRRYELWLNAIDSREQVRADAYVECPVAHPTLFIRREVLAAFGYREVGWPEDYDLFLRLHGAGHAIGVVPQRLLAKRCDPERLSLTGRAYAIDRFTACKASFLANSFLARGDRYVLWGHGGTGRALRRALCDCGKAPAAIVELHPGRLGNTIHGAPVIAPSALEEWRHLPLVASVAGGDARSRIRAALARMGYREGVDFVCAA
jgi:glycosyltransferase involved in cell wall biosynthesis